MNRFLQRRPFVGALVIAIAAKLAMTVAVLLVMGALGGTETAAKALVAMSILGTIPLALYLLTRRTGLASVVGFNHPGAWREPWLIWLPVLLMLINLAGLLNNDLRAPEDPSMFYNAAVQAVSVPLIEEFAFRGLILAVLLAGRHETSGDVLRAVLLSSALFGLWHLPTIAYNPIVGTANVIYAAFAGVGFAAVVLRTRAIWPVLVVHMLIVLTSVAQGIFVSGEAVAAGTLVTPEQAWASAMRSIAFMSPLLLYGLWLLRRPEAILQEIRVNRARSLRDLPARPLSPRR